MKFVTKIALAAFFLFAVTAVAQDEEEVLDTSWNGTGELGFVAVTGNSETSSLNLKLEFIKETEIWRYRFTGSALASSEDGSKDAERYQVEAQADRKLNEKSYIFGAYRHDADKFGAYDPQQSFTVGYGRHLMKSDLNTLKVEIGIGYRKLDERLTNITNSDVIARFLLDDVWQITESTKWGNRILVEAGSDNTFSQFNTDLTVAMNEKFALKIGFELRHNTTVPPGDTEKTDTTTTANLVYSF